jgi:phosphoglycolate phosphatase
MKHIIFDFDGTIADTLPLVLEMYYKVIKPKERFSDEDIQALRNMTAQDVIKWARIPFYRIPRLIVKARRIFRAHVYEVKPFNGIGTVFQELQAHDCKLYVMSSNSPDNINLFLKHNKLDKYFEGIYGNVGIFGKAPMLKKIMRARNLSPSDCWYVGDETRDIEGAKKARLPIVSVTWGYNGKEILTRYKPTAMADTRPQLTKILTT